MWEAASAPGELKAPDEETVRVQSEVPSVPREWWAGAMGGVARIQGSCAWIEVVVPHIWVRCHRRTMVDELERKNKASKTARKTKRVC